MAKFEDQSKPDFKISQTTGDADPDPDDEVSRYLRRAANPSPSPHPKPTLFGRSESIRPSFEANVAPSEPVSLMALLGQSLSDSGEDDGDEEEEEEEEEEEVVLDRECCVCNVRHKGDAFVPCGHTLCRLCSREMGVVSISKGNCPLCNGFILEILNVF